MPDHRAPTRAQHDEAAAIFATARPRLFGIAYRMLGSVADADDLVQETWLRWQQYDRSRVYDPAAFLATTTARLAINQLTSARARHEAYADPRRPEPIDITCDPELQAERAESVRFAVHVILERLTPLERAAFVLHEAFGYRYAQIARLLRSSEAGARQLVSRARRHLTEGRREPVEPREHRRLLAAFLDAAQAGDLASLESVFAETSSAVPTAGASRHGRRPASVIGTVVTSAP